ncbi:kinesin-like protein KIF20B isoform X2 [Ornithorhynchus anatinus]|uniref:Kinesin family member 20B n=1 Tax=Ornithorhynchus anatinus TaxID=9258 RepID=A0A6I8NR80_ORNAN|nr:kinesin-like protein KIF20B isoform X2 [Ornithorhynchus anatinus]
MESFSSQAGAPRPSYIVSADPVGRPVGINVEDIKLDLSHEFSFVASSSKGSNLDSKEHLQICLRIRPFTQSEKDSDSQSCVIILDSTSIALKDPRNVMGRPSEKSGQMAQKFSFSKVFGPETTQKEFFEGSVIQPVRDFLKGQSRLIFTYGVTNAGKTFTFQGTEENLGILPRTMNMLFNSIQGKLYQKMDFKPHRSRDYLRLTPTQVKEEAAVKSALLQQIKEVDSQNCSWDISEGSLMSSVNVSTDLEESIKDCEQHSLNAENYVRFSVWVSFCEIYNDCIYDLFVPVSNDKFQKRKMLRLSQDVKGCSFIKDLQWIQVSDSKEAYRLLKLGIKHQSVAYTKLNSVSSRSHSIFTIRTLQIEDSAVPRVARVSELSLCDLAGSERCTKAQNEGERLRETGNINVSLLTLGKCINALKNSQQSKLQQHVPFRESKLTHYLQGFFSGKGKIFMIVNINQSCSAYDETLNVLKFSAVAQKVFVPDPGQCSQEKLVGQIKSSRDVSFIINNAKSKMSLANMRNSIEWERSLEDLMEDEDLEADTDETEESHMETEIQEEELEENLEGESDDDFIISKEKYQKLIDVIEDLKNKLIMEKKEKLIMELQIRDEVTQEFTQYFSQRETDFKECLLQERELLEESSERRLAILKDLIGKSRTSEDVAMTSDIEETSACLEQKPHQMTPTLNTTQELTETPNEPADHIFPEERPNRISEKETEIRALQEKNKALESHLIVLKSELKNEKTAKAEFGEKLVNLQEELSSSEDRAFKLREEMQQIQSNYEKAVSESHLQKVTIEEQEEKIMKLSEEVTASRQSIAKQVSAVKAMQAKIDQLCMLGSVGDFTSLKDPPGDSMKTNDPCANTQRKDSNVEGVGRATSFHCSMEAIWEECKEMVKTASQKRQWIQELVQQIEKLLREVKNHEDENNQLKLKIRETLNQENLLKEKERLVNELKEQLTNQKALLKEKESLNNQFKEKDRNQESLLKEKERLVNELKEQLTNQEALLKDKESLINQFKGKDTNLESLLKEKERLVNELKEQLTNQEALLKDKESLINQFKGKDTNLESLLKEKERLVNELKEQLANQEALLKDKEGLINQFKEKDANQESLLKEKERLVNQLKEQLTNQEALLKEKESLVSQLKEKITNQESLLKERESHLNQLKEKYTYQEVLLKEKECLINQQKVQIQEKADNLDIEVQNALREKHAFLELEKQATSYKAKIEEMENILGSKRANDNHLARLEQLVQERESHILKVETHLKDLQENHQNSIKAIKELNDSEIKLKEEINQLTNNLQSVNDSLQLKVKENETRMQKTQKLEEELSASCALAQNLKADLQRKKDEYEDLKEKLADAKKQIQQVSAICEEEKLLRNKVNDLEKIKKQFAQELIAKQQVIQQLKDQLKNEKAEETVQQYRSACEDLKIKEKIIEDMRMTLEEQEQTQLEQDRVLEARMEEAERLAAELEKWQQKYKELETKSRDEMQQNTNQNHEGTNTATLNEELIKLKEQMEESEKKHEADRRKWVEEKMGLITQAKEAENHRNREMKKYTKDRERHAKQQTELERLTTQLAEKESDLQKWREERDKLVAILEIQLKTLLSSNVEKDNEIKQLKKTISENPEKQTTDDDKAGQTIPISCDTVENSTKSLQCPSNSSSLDETEASPDVVLESSDVSTENGKTSRFPKPELEIQFTPLQPNRMAVKHSSSTLPVTVKITRSRKRKSHEMDEEFVKSENKKNAARTNLNSPFSKFSSPVKREQKSTTAFSSKKGHYSQKQTTLRTDSASVKKDGTLQKLGGFLHGSPKFHSKAKKLIETISSPKPTEVEPSKENKSRTKRAKRKLYSTNISSPVDIPGQVIIWDQKNKESDHQILRRQLRPRLAK